MSTKSTPTILKKEVEKLSSEQMKKPLLQGMEAITEGNVNTQEQNPIEKTGYVIMLDVLGFREFVSKNKEEDFFSTWSALKKSLIDKKKSYDTDKNKTVTLDVLCLSDTLIICLSYKDASMNSDSRYLLSSIPGIIDIFFMSFMIDHSIFFRGAISYGKFRFSSDENIVMGDAIDEVSSWYEANDWIGIILAPSAQYAREYMIEVKDKRRPKALERINRRFVKYDEIPFKDKFPPICSYAYYWFVQYKTLEQKSSNVKTVLEIFSKLKHDPSYALKYSNAIKFIRHFSNTEEDNKLVVPNK